MRFTAKLFVDATGGKVSVSDHGISVEGASATTLFIVITSYSIHYTKLYDTSHVIGNYNPLTIFTFALENKFRNNFV